MVVATRELSESMPGGGVVLHAAGDHLERFDTWDFAVQRALRRLGYVADRDGDDPVSDTPAVTAARAGLVCPQCPDRTFVNHQGLRLHTTRIHGAE